MRKTRGRLGATFSEWLMVSCICTGLAAGAHWFGWVDRFDAVFYDAALSSASRAAPADVVIVAIDDRSLAAIGQWPWSRGVHAALLRQLTNAGAEAVAFDVIFSEPSRSDPAGDAALARRVDEHGGVVLPVTHGGYRGGSDGETPPLPSLTAAAARLGHIQMELDPDGIARRVYLWEGLAAPRHPQLGLALLQLVEPARSGQWAPPEAASGSGWQRAQPMHIPYLGPPGTFPYLSYIDVLRGDLPPGRLDGAVVLVGASAAGLGDTVPTPTSGHGRAMPGVEINATVFHALRSGELIHPLSRPVVSLGGGLLVLGLMLVMLRTGPRTALLSAVALAALLGAGAWLALVAAGVWAPPTSAMLATMLAYPLWSWRRLEAAQRYLDTELVALDVDGGPLELVGSSRGAATHDRFGARIALVREAARRQRVLQRFITEALERLPVGVVVAGAGGRARLANRRALELLGVRTADEAGRALAQIAGVEHLSLPAQRGSEPVREVEVELPGGRVALVSFGPLRDESGRPYATLVGMAEVTALREAQRNREQTLHFLSHDLRAPLASILSLVEPASGAQPAVSAEEQRRLGRVARHGRSALRLADNFLRLVKAERLDPDSLVPLALEMVVQDAVEEVWDLAVAKSITLRLVEPDIAPGNEAVVNGDSELLCRALVNLLTNAVKYTPAGGTVTVTMYGEPGRWVVSVCDNGPGIPAAQRDGLFRAFSRLPGPARDRPEGVGLGLVMVHTVVVRHGGAVDVGDRDGGGTCFCVSLPVLGEEGEERVGQAGRE